MKEMPIGVIVSLQSILDHGSEELDGLDMRVCQITCWDVDLYTQENAARVREALGGRIDIACLWAGWPPPAMWNFYEGPLTLGLVPATYRPQRIEALVRGAEFAALIGTDDVTTHVGFVPENPSSTEYREVVVAVREVAQRCWDLGLHFNFETGQETPTTLMRTIEDVGLQNLGINLDPANLLMYGKANPTDAVDIYGELIRGVHVKDGRYPTNGHDLGEETPVGQGLVDLTAILRKLDALDYSGALIIEREISGPQQKRDILKARDHLRQIMFRG